MEKINKKHKDRLFRFIFREKKELLSLYNAINDTDYKNPEDLTINTIEDVIFMGMKNDTSFIVDNAMNLYEHQSTYSPNLPLRGLFYFSDLYRSYIEPKKSSLYSRTRLRIPIPQYIVFYNGSDEMSDRKEIHLSDLFLKGDQNFSPALECTAVLLNINAGHNKKIMEKCRVLGEYAEFLSTVRLFMERFVNYEEAVSRAVDDCIRRDVLRDVLLKNKSEVVDMILTEYDEEEVREFLRQEAWDEGMEAGMEAGIEEGIRVMIKFCLDLKFSKEDTMNKIKTEFLLSQKDAEFYMKKFGNGDCFEETNENNL